MSKLDETQYMSDGYPAKEPAYYKSEEDYDAAPLSDERMAAADFNQARASQIRLARAVGPRSLLAAYASSPRTHAYVQGGELDYNGVHYTVPTAGAMELTLDATNYIYLNLETRTIGVVTSGFAASGPYMPMAEMTCDSEGVLLDEDGDPIVNDRRPAFSWTRSGVTQLSGGTGIDIGGEESRPTVTNTGVTDLIAGEGIGVSEDDGTYTVTDTAGAVTETRSVWPRYPNGIETGFGDGDAGGTILYNHDSTARANYVQHKEAGGSEKNYSVMLEFVLPQTFTGWGDGGIEIQAWRDHASANGTMYVYRQNSETPVASVSCAPAVSTWTGYGIAVASLGSWSAGDIVRVRLKLASKDGKMMRFSRIDFNIE